MSESMVDRVAKAIAAEQHQGWIFSEDQRMVEMCVPEKIAAMKAALMSAARAAIEAMRLPDDAWTRPELTSGMVDDFNFVIDLALNKKGPRHRSGDEGSSQ